MLVLVDINNWEKYNPKRDQSTYSWLRLNNDIFNDPKIWGLNAEHKLVWIAILCEASKKNLGLCEIETDQLAINLKLPHKKIMQSIDMFVERGLTTFDDRQLPQTTPTNVRTNERIMADSRSAVSDIELERLYLDYPRKEKKKQFLQRAKKHLTKPEHVEKFRTAMENYKTRIRSEGIDPKYIKQPTTFFSEWEDWLDPLNGRTDPPDSPDPGHGWPESVLETLD